MTPEEGDRMRAEAHRDRLRKQEREWRQIVRSGTLHRAGTFEAETPPPPWLRRLVPRRMGQEIVRFLEPRCPRPVRVARRRERRVRPRARAPDRDADADPPLLVAVAEEPA